MESNEDLQNWVSDKKSEDVINALIKINVPVAPTYQINEVVGDPQVKARNMIIEVNHPRAGVIKQPNFPLKFSETDTIVRAAPMLGQHNEQILNDLGYGEKEIVDLRKAGVIT